MVSREILAAYKAGKLSTAEVLKHLEALRTQAPKKELSENQKGLWAYQKIFPESNVYNIPICLRVRGEFDRAALEAAWAALLRAYPILTTVIEEEGGKPYQRWAKERRFIIEYEDISALAPEQVVSYVKERAKPPFSLQAGPLVRLHVLSRSSDEQMLLLVAHHIIVDGRSLQLLLEALLGAYAKSCRGETLAPRATKTQYDDFVAWEQRFLASDEARAQREYWLKQLEGPLPVLALPTDRPRAADRRRVADSSARTVSAPLSEALRAFCSTHRISPAVMFLGIYNVFLHHYGSEGDGEVVVGVPIMGRPEQAFDDVVGNFANMIAVRSRIEESRSVLDTVKSLQLTLTDGMDYALYPFPRVVREVKSGRTTDVAPIFQAAFEFQSANVIDLQSLAHEFQIEFVDGLSQEGEYELVLEVLERADGFMLRLKYDASLFDRARIESMLAHYLSLMQQMVDDHDRALCELDLLTAADADKVLASWNATALDYPRDVCLHDLFDRQAQRTPEKIAVTCDGHSLTYRELQDRSDALGRYLQARGVGPDRLVGLSVERSLDMIVGLLGILKAGGAYVPLDPAYPIDRLRYMLDDSGAALVVTQARLLDLLSPLLGDRVQAVVLDRDWSQIERAPARSTGGALPPTSSNLAYVMYTSGSTGRPKGVMITHQALVNFLTSMADMLVVGPQDSLLAVTTYSFDIAGLELYLPIVRGAHCHICTDGTARNVDQLLAVLKRVKPTLMQATPTTWTMLFQAGWKNETGIKILCGGEALPQALRQSFVASRSPAWNMFGPTETTIWSTAAPIHGDGPITIGRPIANTQVYVVDTRLRPVPVGVAGELCIAGDGLALGYLNQPALTEQKFIDNPFTPGTKLYKTGDLARWLADGTLEYIGRIDAQVKVRGFRIELGEIETQLTALPLIGSAAVVAYDDGGRQKLVAYYVVRPNGTGDRALDARQIRERLKTVLPAYMVPSQFVELDALPLTPNGKVDRKTLTARDPGASKRLPRTPAVNDSEIVGKILAIWREVLDTDDIALDDGFFDVGGDSVLAAVVAERIRQEVPCDFDVTTLFKYASVGKISQFIADAKRRERNDAAAANIAIDSNLEPGKTADQPAAYPDYYKDSIAIIGISCQFPGSQDHRRFWDNLRHGREGVRTLSPEALRDAGLPEPLLSNPNYVPVYSSIEGKDRFDPRFFDISPRDAELMDPQLRLLLMHAWKAFEDAGYVSSQVPDTGVFMSASNSFYHSQLGTNAQEPDPEGQAAGYVPWLLAQGGTIPTIISHRLGLKGPSFFVHSNCSSSLAGLYSAYQALLSGNAKCALVGAATLFASERLGYLYQPGLNFSSDGRLKAFDANADGMVAGEGVAVVLLKRAEDAIADGDNIYALVRGVALNNDGADKAGFYAPSVQGQADVIRRALNVSDVDPETISYVEAHGTGTRIGDPIELAALTEAYKTFTGKHRFCGIGSVKTNIGHLDTAAGLAGCIKIALGLTFGEIAPSLHYKRPNPGIDFDNSPFYVVDRLTPWARTNAPLRAALSSFGIGGANAHAILEQAPRIEVQKEKVHRGSYLIPVSARNDERLIEYARSLLDYLKETVDVDLADLAYTFQVGREAMASRLVFVADSRQTVIGQLERVLAGGECGVGVYRGEAKAATADEALTHRHADALIERAVSRKAFDEVAQAWADGMALDWRKLYVGATPRRISLPTYPFAQERYWIAADRAAARASTSAATAHAGVLHPLLQQNTSDFNEQRFSSTFTGGEFFLADHVIKGKRVLPGVVYLEMVRAAIAQALGDAPGRAGLRDAARVRLKNVVWPQAVTVADQPARLHVRVAPEASGEVSFEVYSGPMGTAASENLTRIHCQGRAAVQPHADAEHVDVARLRQQCNVRTLSADDCYSVLPAIGFVFGPSFRAIKAIHMGQDESGRPQALAELELPEPVSSTLEDYVLHPSLMDAALGGLALDAGASTNQSGKPKSTLPFVLHELTVYGACKQRLFALIRFSEGSQFLDKVQKYDIDLCDEDGVVCVRMRGYSRRVLDGEFGETARIGTRLFKPEWRPQLIEDGVAHAYAQRWVVLGEGLAELAASVEAQVPQARCEVLRGEGSMAARFESAATQMLALLQVVLQAKPSGDVLLQLVVADEGESQLLAGLSGLLKSARQENPKLLGQVIGVGAQANAQEVVAALQENANAPHDARVRYVSGKRQVVALTDLTDLTDKQSGESPQLPWRDAGVYLITGGTGGLGMLFAQEIAQRVHAPVLVLSGRSASDTRKQAQLDQLRALGATAVYRQADIADPLVVQGLVDGIVDEFGALHGVLHCAGVILDNLLLRKSAGELRAVLAPKVSGVVALDHATKALSLDWLVLFSSVAGVFGNLGQSDYAAANGFLDGYAAYRNALTAAGQRHGRTISLNWPLWADGGMQVDAAVRERLQTSGMHALETAAGVRALYDAFVSSESQVVVLAGELERLRDVTATDKKPAPAEKAVAIDAHASHSDADETRERVLNLLMKTTAKLLKISADDLEPDVELSKYGFDSISLTRFSNELNQTYRLELSPTLFFEYSTLHGLADYLAQEHASVFVDSSKPAYRSSQEAISPAPSALVEAPAAAVRLDRPRRFASASLGAGAETFEDNQRPEPIAIVGMSGRFPMAEDLDAFWENLVGERNCIAEVPKMRWDWEAIYGDPTKEGNKTNVKWGGFIDGIDEFDPLFFKISPSEAEGMDPQQRLLMTHVWKALEDAGYAAQDISGSRTAVFVGMAESGYSGLIARSNRPVEGSTMTGAVPSLGPGRMSFFLNLHGPSEPIETACSSSLVAIHRGLAAIRNDGCEMALVGGVHAMLTPAAHISFSKAGMLSEDGRCKAFSKDADGYVRGEGVGILVLKKLSAAERDGDHIYGVVLASAENHGGRANSLTAPNPRAQADLLKDAYSRAGIAPSTVGYIEAHGTGTSLGDPIEIEALKTAFKSFGEAEGDARCGVGSVKTNIGHLEFASGVAGVIKVLLQLKHKTLVKSLHSEEINPYIQLEQSPFYIVHETEPWPALRTESGEALPRRAGVSSFGFGGVNAHVVIEEYVPDNRRHAESRTGHGEPVAIVLSAKNEARLKERAEQLLQALKQGRIAESELARVAYTLQIGRDAMEARLGLIVESVAQLIGKLEQFVLTDSVSDLHLGHIKRDKAALSLFKADEDLRDAVEAWIAKGKLERILDLWVKGLAFDWRRLYPNGTPRRISLPTYPFAKERYWISVSKTSAPVHAPVSDVPPVAVPAHVDPASAASEERPELMTFEESWCESAQTPADGSIALRVIVCFFNEAEHRRKVRETVASYDASIKVAFVTHDASDRDDAEVVYSISVAADMPAYASVLSTIEAEHGRIDAVLYGWPLETPQWGERATPVVHLIQALARNKSSCKRVLLGTSGAEALSRSHSESWIGFERSLGRVLPQLKIAVMHLEGDAAASAEEWTQHAWAELNAVTFESTRYREGERYVLRVRPTVLGGGESRLRQGGTYLITGGWGGLGQLFARHLAERYGAKLILTGRSPLNAERERQLRELEALGAQVEYLQADVCDASAMQPGLARARERFGAIHGVIHAAGIDSAQSILTTPSQQFEHVLEPKVKGTLVLDALLQDQALDFVCYFSSTSAVLGDFSACSYAIGNRFLMAYARERNGQPGAARVICWPLWRDGGMQVGDEGATRLYLESSGQRALAAPEGLDVFERALSAQSVQYLVMSGRRSRIHAMLGVGARSEASSATMQPAPVSAGKGYRTAMQGFTLEQCVTWDLKELVSEQLKVPRQRLDVTENLADFGFDSISLATFARNLSAHYGIEFTPAQFFSHPTLEQLGVHLQRQHGEMLEAFYREGGQVEVVQAAMPVAASAPVSTSIAALPTAHAIGSAIETRSSATGDKKQPRDIADEPIAIIGMSGRFPQARSVAELWAILSGGKDAVEEIPGERFDWREYFGDPASEPGKTNCKWGGFVPGVAEFDPLFFEVSPREAERMDPRQRLLLQEAWKALEDAGYGSEQLNRSKVGMFVGAEQGDYQLLPGSRGAVTGNHDGMLGARLAYFLDLKGPVMTINTACSSGLVAAHQACLSLHAGECDTAIVGAANLLLTPGSYAGMSQMGMLSSDGHCFAFDKRANGMVPGEAVVALVLKRLSQAQADGDPIYALIHGSGINYDGKTNGITAPSGASQTALLRQVYERHAIDPESISHVVTHGTGTRLGDPIEINALYDTFKDQTSSQGFCALTSTKSNLGHTLGASGLVSLVALTQGLRHEVIPASLHCEQESDYIQWQSSPFYVNKETKRWPARAGHPRRGAVSAFGMTGTNAHMVVDAYDAPETQVVSNVPPSFLLVLSAKTSEALEHKIADILTVLREGEWDAQALSQMSYTLLCGRQHFRYRSAVVVRDRDHAVHVWSEAASKEKLSNLFHGEVGRDFTGQKAIESYARDLLVQTALLQGERQRYQENLHALADLYCQGYALRWDQLYGEHKPRRISLPTYPFANERYWVPVVEERSTIGGAALHPLLHQNTSTLEAQRFSSTFSGEEFFLRDHVVQGHRVLPGVAHLEMARAAIAQATGAATITIEQAVFARPLVVGEAGQTVHIALIPRDGGEIDYEIYTQADQDEPAVLHSQGQAMLGEPIEPEIIALDELRSQCQGARMDGSQCYAVFDTLGLQYGASFRGLESLQVGHDVRGQDQVLAKLALPAGLSMEPFVLHPSMMDGALHASLGMNLSVSGGKTALPFALERLEFVSACPSQAWVWVRYSDGCTADSPVRKLDVDVMDEQGRVYVRMRSFSSRIVEGSVSQAEQRQLSYPDAVHSEAAPVEPANTTAPAAEPAVVPQAAAVSSMGDLTEQTAQYLKRVLSATLKLSADRIDVNAPLEQYGIDSILVLQLTADLEKRFGPLSKTLFFEYQTLRALTDYFVQSHSDRLVSLLDIGANVQAAKPAVPADAAPALATVRRATRTSEPTRNRRFAPRTGKQGALLGAGAVDIAIIGMSGRYPEARNLDVYWSNLRAGKDCIREIPAERWDHGLYFDADKEKLGKSYSKWGGFIEGVDQFDPLFFNISPREAEVMDPQERLFLQCVYETIEDAGYTRERLRTYQAQGLDGNVGVFVGVMYEEYQLYGAQEQARGRGLAISGSASSIANRVSYFCNFHGPSLAIDTMCSSSLTALHLACISLQRGECEVAVAGGVNVSVHPNKYLLLSSGKFASSKGRCESFGEGGDGYVPGEGVGAVLLKPLAQAIADGDQIHGVIKGTAINHGGKTNGYTVPNPNAQASVIGQVFKNAGVHPRTISYIEAHGTGTSLGDPIEITGLSKAFGQGRDAGQYCAIGSAKSNIGHCESAAGIAGITKVLLQMKYKTLVPSLHSETLNPNIDFAKTPFVVQRELGEWKRPVVSVDGAPAREYPRIAGVSSFGAGGSNAHVIIEEYIPAQDVRAATPVSPATPAVVVLSAKNDERLKEHVRQLLDAIEAKDFSDAQLMDVAYTLQVGREAMEARIGVLADSVDALKSKLGAILAGEDVPDVYVGQVKRNKDALGLFAADEDLQQAIESWVSKGKYGKLLELWVKGLAFDWERLYPAAKPQRLSLPTYPFAKGRYWVPAPASRPQAVAQSAAVVASVDNGFDTAFFAKLIDEIDSDSINIDAAVAEARRKIVASVEPTEAG
ncbi:amino acid adenylation domain-containing protein [Trinickia sp. NRRL B-1857]|uniref:amino acid adenylation domain-containing protein n=1 Tax=Trinickia sp. NRRL B-1857 TaxID=3162879 RepID=UPI003D266C79